MNVETYHFGIITHKLSVRAKTDGLQFVSELIHRFVIYLHYVTEQAAMQTYRSLSRQLRGNAYVNTVRPYTLTYQYKCPHMLTTASWAVSKHILHSKRVSSSSASLVGFSDEGVEGDAIGDRSVTTRITRSRDRHMTKLTLQPAAGVSVEILSTASPRYRIRQDDR